MSFFLLFPSLPSHLLPLIRPRARVGQEEGWLVSQALAACFCAIPVNSDTLLEVQEHLETHPGPFRVVPSTLYLLYEGLWHM